MRAVSVPALDGSRGLHITMISSGFAAIGDQEAAPAGAKALGLAADRLAVIAAAVELGPDTPLVLIAERAGVGIASLHRYFPTTAALFAEVSARDVSHAAASGPRDHRAR